MGGGVSELVLLAKLLESGYQPRRFFRLLLELGDEECTVGDAFKSLRKGSCGSLEDSEEGAELVGGGRQFVQLLIERSANRAVNIAEKQEQHPVERRSALLEHLTNGFGELLVKTGGDGCQGPIGKSAAMLPADCP